LVDSFDDLTARGVRIEVVAADVADAPAMTALFNRFGRELPRLRGIVHAAFAGGPHLLRDLTDAEIEGMFRAKVEGAQVLDSLSRGLDLQFFVLFSSTTALLGSAQLGHYAAASCFVDALAHARHAAGQPAIAINWGTWEAIGGAGEREQELVRRSGLRPLPIAAGLRALEWLLLEGVTQRAVARADWSLLRSVYEVRRGMPLLEALTPASVPTDFAASAEDLQLLARLGVASERERKNLLRAFLCEAVGDALGLPSPDVMDPGRGFFAMGMDSLSAVALKRRLEAAFGLPIPTIAIFEHPTVASFTDYALAELLHLPDPLLSDPTEGPSERDLVALLAARLERLT
jgi:phthiocerol/phenolphthiocerol synthesis type-I polyketide synthase B